MKPSKRQVDYRCLSNWVQQVILRRCTRGGVDAQRQRATSPAEQGARCARDLEFSAVESKERLALGGLVTTLQALQDATGERAQATSYDAVVAAADGLGDVCSDFANPPLNAIWATAGRAEQGKLP